MREVTGDTAGLKPSEIQALERLYRRRVPPAEVISSDLANVLATLSSELGRQIGLLIDRRGQIEHVVVGDATRLVLPEVGRLRAAKGRLRGLRLVHTHLRGEPLTQDDLTDLALLRFDLIAAIEVTVRGLVGAIHVGHLLPDAGQGAFGPSPGEARRASPRGTPWRVLPPKVLGQLGIDAGAMIRALEDELDRTAVAGAAATTLPKAMVVHVAVGKAGRRADPEARVAELRELCHTAGVAVMDVVVQQRPEADPRTLVGRGKLEELVVRAMQLDCELIIFDPDLSPTQARTISDATELKVLDRTMLILDIFAQRAQSRDGKLQVELAQLRYTLPRLVEKNTMMSRLTGGIGGRGPGETKLEISRRRARARITRLERIVKTIARHRALRREVRTRREVPTVAIVGYTNAGKTTLLNTLTESTVWSSELLFATLDPTSRRLRFPEERELVLTDTVGFIRDLPKDLVAAFRATLEELSVADLLVHVVDGADPDHEAHIVAVDGILADLGLAEKPRVLVYNKADKLDAADAKRDAAAHGALSVSARDRESLRPLLATIEDALWREGRDQPRPATSSASP